MPVLLIVDDDPTIMPIFRALFDNLELTILEASTASEGMDLVARHHPDVAILDINLPDLSGLEMLRRLHGLDARIPVIFMTGQATTETAIEAMQLGAFEYLLKDDFFQRRDTKRLHQVVEDAFAISQLMRDQALVPAEKPAEHRSDVLIGRCPAMQEVYKMIGRVAFQDAPVVLVGERGTGKKLVARAIYQHSKRSSQPLRIVHCARMPGPLLESELFGHEPNAFPGADCRHIGKIEQNNGGTLLLDEIDDLPHTVQTKIMRLLQDQQFERLGGSDTLAANVRLIATSNRGLAALLRTGQFREDLYYRLAAFTIRIPPLHDRGDDLQLIVDHCIQAFAPQLGKAVRQVAPAAMEILRHHSWPGNLPELQGVLKQALLQATGPVLLPGFLPPGIRAEPQTAGQVVLNPARPEQAHKPEEPRQPTPHEARYVSIHDQPTLAPSYPQPAVAPEPEKREPPTLGSSPGIMEVKPSSSPRASVSDSLHERPTMPPPSALLTPGPALANPDPATVDFLPETKKEARTKVPNYEIMELLGQGAMGIVYKARQISLNRIVALKMILTEPGVPIHEENLRRFRAEAEAVARLQHPNIVQVYEIGEQDGQPYIALEFIEGGNLAALVRDRPLEPRKAAGVVQQIARGIHAVHQHGIIHRDLKPANVLLTGDGTPKISDFGIAKNLSDVSHTQTGVILGTPCYMSPEQALSKKLELGPATDIYALGAIFYHLLTGHPPYQGDSVLTILWKLEKLDVVPPRRHDAKVPKDLETICLKCLEKDAHRRYSSAEGLAQDLERYLAGEPILARPSGYLERFVKWVQRRPERAVILFLCLVILAEGLLLLLRQVSEWLTPP